jgi:anti-anti-sigma regulatory factor
MTKIYVAPEYFGADDVIKGRPLLEELAESAEDIVVDMTGVKHLDCAGVGALSFLMKRLLPSGHQLRLVSIGGQPARFLRDLQLLHSDQGQDRTNPDLVFGPGSFFVWR